MAADWKKIKAEYIRTDISLRQIADKYGVSLSSIARRSKNEKWADLRKQSNNKASMKIVESVSNTKAKEVDKIQSVADRLLSLIEDKITDPEFMKDSKDMRALTGALKDLREIKGCKSELDMQEQIARIEKLRKEVNSEEKTDNTIRVVIEGELNEYA